VNLLKTALAISSIVCIAAPQMSGQTAKTVLDRVYSNAQADRGDLIFHANCAKCHEGADVDGPALEGDPFIDRWREDSLAALFRFMKTKMPQDSPGKLSDAEYLDVVAYLLKSNEYPAGDQELTANAAAKTLLVGKGGPAPLPTNSIVRVTGCLEKSGGDWMLTKATAPVRAHEGDSTEESGPGGGQRGTQSFRLRNLEDSSGGAKSESYADKSVRVKGVLIRQSSGDRINVLSLEPGNSSCTP
jgi:mono/diheme cytochrome c family protein